MKKCLDEELSATQLLLKKFNKLNNDRSLLLSAMNEIIRQVECQSSDSIIIGICTSVIKEVKKNEDEY